MAMMMKSLTLEDSPVKGLEAGWSDGEETDYDSDDEVDDAESAHTTHHHKHDLDPTSDTDGRQCNV
eukprot:6357807-Karenia_brevis.AAC.1